MSFTYFLASYSPNWSGIDDKDDSEDDGGGVGARADDEEESVNQERSAAEEMDSVFKPSVNGAEAVKLNSLDATQSH